MRHTWWTLIVALASLACSADDVSMMTDTTAAASSGGESTTAASNSGSLDDSGSTGPGFVDSSSGGSDGPTDPPSAGVLACATFTIPPGATVQEFSFQGAMDGAPSVLSGQTVVVSVVDISHPRRDQSELCPGNHPLDGCATVDYGAFGMTHDNRITFEGPDGPWAIHLYKDRSLQPEAEPLPVNE